MTTQKIAIPRTADGSIDVLRLKMRDAKRVNYAAHAGTGKELAEMVMVVTRFQRDMRTQLMEIAA